jgi:hypothetical protein
VNTETKFKPLFLARLDQMSKQIESKRQEREASGAEDEAVLERIKLNVVDIFRRMFLRSLDEMPHSQNMLPELGEIIAGNPDKWERSCRLFRFWLARIPSNWTQALQEAEANGDVCEAVKERVKLEIRDVIQDEFEQARLQLIKEVAE